MKSLSLLALLGVNSLGFIIPDKSNFNIPRVRDFKKEAISWFNGGNDYQVPIMPGDRNELHEGKSIYEVLSGNPKFSKIVKAIDFVDSIADALKNTDNNLTFFAFPNKALPHHPDHITSLASVIEEIENPASFVDDEDKKKLFKQIVFEVLSYHILPHNFNSHALSQNVTYETNLAPSDGSFAEQPRRIRVQGPFYRGRGGYVNLYSKIIHPDCHASNGIIHEIALPLIPPFSILEQSFVAPKVTSIWTTLLQKTGLQDEVEYRIYPESFNVKNKTTAPVVTAFIPMNNAFTSLPKDLQLFLFSPFGEKVLRKLLQFHIVPNHIVHTEFLFNATHKHSVDTQTVQSSLAIERDDTEDKSASKGMIHPPHHPPHHPPNHPPGRGRDIISNTTFTLPTLLANHSINFEVVKYDAGRWIPPNMVVVAKANGIPAFVYDVPARNGVFHWIPFLIVPPHDKEDDVKGQKSVHHCGGGEGDMEVDAWSDWKDWLPQWAEKN